MYNYDPVFKEAPEGKDAGGILKIYTLGRFQVCFKDQILFDKTGRFQKISELLRYLIAHRGRFASPETILESIWPDNDYIDPRNVFKNMIYRLKQGLAEIQVPDPKAYIVHSNGAFSWNINAPCWLDADVFEALCKEAQGLLNRDPFQAAAKYRKALDLYLGHYLPECQYSHWVLQKRNHYRRLFTISAYDLFSFEKEKRLFSELIQDCEKILSILSIEDIDESIHLFYMEALLEEGKIAQARSHYEYITSLNYRESGSKPSPALQNIYRAIKAYGAQAKNNITDLQKMLKSEDTSNDALLCDPETFRLVCLLEKRLAEQNNRPMQLGFLTLAGPGFQAASAVQLTFAVERLRNVLLEKARRVDVICSWNENQFSLLMPGLNQEEAEALLHNIRDDFTKNCPAEKVILNSSIQSFLPPEIAVFE